MCRIFRKILLWRTIRRQDVVGKIETEFIRSFQFGKNDTGPCNSGFRRVSQTKGLDALDQAELNAILADLSDLFTV